MSEPQYRIPHPMRPNDDIVFVNWHIASHTEMDGGFVSTIAIEWWDATEAGEREQALEALRRSVAESASEDAGRTIDVGQVSYTVHRGDEAPVGPGEEFIL
ncbi:hypothetical protein [Streptomyces sp. NPDC088736]|uniref:hypothetical protein n=1 Tax=Streptomyces sp. NPDC088736 TaxID=3365881 RepID=UPI003821AA1B